MELTPVENRNGLWLKREDLLTGDYGVNGSKLRACRYLIGRAVSEGARVIVSASSVLSPQSAMASVVASEHGVECQVIVGGTTPEKAIKHKSVAIAHQAGAQVSAIAVGYNPALQSAARARVEGRAGYWRLPYGITAEEHVDEFMRVGAPQVMNLPDEVETIVLPFGSGNTAAGVLLGLRDFPPSALRRVVLLGIGPDRQKWLRERLSGNLPDVELVHHALHPGFATYGDRMKYRLEGIDLHPTYEGKCARFLDLVDPPWWAARDGKTLFWIVGGPI